MKKQLAKTLSKIVGSENFSDTQIDRLTYAYDATGPQYLPDAVVFPKSVAQIAQIMAVANEYRLPVVPRGAGSGLSCGALAVNGGLVMVMALFKKILEIDPANMFAVVEPGVVTAALHAAVERQGLFYPPDPASMDFSTIGGNIAENAGGMRAVKYGVTREYVMGLELVLPTGKVIQTGSKCIKDVVGYDLTNLFVGSEGTLGIITKAILKLLPKPEARQTLTAAFTRIQQAVNTVPEIIRQKTIPATLEFIDRHCLLAVAKQGHLRLPRDTEALLLMDVEGGEGELPSIMEKIRRTCRQNGATKVEIAADRTAREQIWELRRNLTQALGCYAIRGEGEDIVVPRTRIAEIITEMDRIAADFGLFVINFGHAGDGNIHVSLAEKGRPVSEADVKAASLEILKATVRLGGRIAAEHGIGATKRDKIGLNINTEELRLMRGFKALVDPHNILNPGKIFPQKIGGASMFGPSLSDAL
ncbi:MAG: FAD-linked oxidase C-terminal domain-containing protein [Desulfosarcinaceae bacterium]|jgi:glycolate oxidase